MNIKPQERILLSGPLKASDLCDELILGLLGLRWPLALLTMRRRPARFLIGWQVRRVGAALLLLLLGRFRGLLPLALGCRLGAFEVLSAGIGSRRGARRTRSPERILALETAFLILREAIAGGCGIVAKGRRWGFAA